MQKNIDEIMRRTYRYHYEDGLVEIAVGLLFACIGLAILGFTQAQGNPSMALVTSFGLMAVTGGGVFVVRWIVTKMKARIVHTRTGVVRHNNQSAQGRWWIVAAAAGLVLLMFVLPEKYTQMSSTIGALLTIILVFIGGQVKVSRLQVTALLPLAVGVAAAFFEIDEVVGSALVFVASGIVMALLGAVTFVRYLRNNPLPADEG